MKRRKWTSQQTLAIVLEGLRGKVGNGAWHLSFPLFAGKGEVSHFLVISYQ